MFTSSPDGSSIYHSPLRVVISLYCSQPVFFESLCVQIIPKAWRLAPTSFMKVIQYLIFSAQETFFSLSIIYSFIFLHSYEFIYLYSYGFMDIYFILWVIVPNMLLGNTLFIIKLLKLFQLWPVRIILASYCVTLLYAHH